MPSFILILLVLSLPREAIFASPDNSWSEV
jgi:hypothetical protein